jgi:hypothetical protein
MAAGLLARLNEAQIKSGELKSVDPLTHSGRTFYRRAKQGGKGPDEFYYQNESIIAFSQQHAAIRRVIDLDRESNPVPGPTIQLMQFGADKAFATFWLNPRSFDAELALKLKNAEPGEAAFLQSFQPIWKATDSFALTVRLEKHLEVNLSVVTRWSDLPPALRRFGGSLQEPAVLAKLFPPDAMLAIVGRTDLSASLDILTEFLTPDARQSLKGSLEQSLGSVFGKKELPQLPDHLGPDWGICVTAPSADSKSVLPEIVAALRIRPGKDGKNVERSLLDAMDAIATLARIAYNSGHPDSVERKTVRFGNVDVVYLTGDGLPAGFEPAYAMKDGFLFVATSPAAIGRLTPAKTAPAEERLVSISFRNIDRYLKDRGDGLKQLLTAQNKMTAEEAERQIAQLRAAMELLDRLELIHDSTKPGQTRLTLRLHFTAPLRK